MSNNGMYHVSTGNRHGTRASGEIATVKSSSYSSTNLEVACNHTELAILAVIMGIPERIKRQPLVVSYE